MDIFVGSLPFKITEAKLKEVFEQFGEVTDVKLIINKITRLKKGFGFVTMPDHTQALNAIKALNGTELLDRKIAVSESGTGKNSPAGAGAKTAGGPKGDFRKKKHKEIYVTFGDDNRKKPGDKGFKIRRKAANFKVGKRRG